MPITTQQVLEASSKHRNEVFWEDFKNKYKRNPDHHRDPATIQGFLSKEKLTEMLLMPDNRELLIDIGLVIMSNGKVFFFTDDPVYGCGVLPEEFETEFINSPHSLIGKNGEFENVDDVIDYYYPHLQHLNSLEELVKYVNGE